MLNNIILLEYGGTPDGIINMASNFVSSAKSMRDFIKTVRNEDFNYHHILFRLLEEYNYTIPDFHQHLVKEIGLDISDNVVRKWFDPTGEKSSKRTPDLDIIECFADFIGLSTVEKRKLLIIAMIKRARKDTKDTKVLVAMIDYLDDILDTF